MILGYTYGGRRDKTASLHLRDSLLPRRQISSLSSEYFLAIYSSTNIDRYCYYNTVHLKIIRYSNDNYHNRYNWDKFMVITVVLFMHAYWCWCNPTTLNLSTICFIGLENHKSNLNILLLSEIGCVLIHHSN